MKRKEKRAPGRAAPALRPTGQLGKAKPKFSKLQIHAMKLIMSPEISFALSEQGNYVFVVHEINHQKEASADCLGKIHIPS